MLLIKSEIVEIWNKLNQPGMAKLKGASIVFALETNKAILKPILKGLEAASKPSDQIMEYQRRRGEVVESMRAFTAAGACAQPGEESEGQGMSVAELSQLLISMNETYKDAIEEQQKKNKDYEEMLEEEIAVNFAKFDFKKIPKEITGEQMAGLFPFLKGSPDDIDLPSPPKAEETEEE